MAGDAWLESLDEFKQLQKYENAKQQKRNDMMKAERTVRGDWKPRTKGRGDWICPRHECGNINFGYRDECNLCGENRPKSNFFNIKGRFVRPSDTGGEIGEEASTKSGGLFNAEDWICRCGNINWAKRSACHECGRARIELAPRLGARMADSEGRAIKSELASRAKDKKDDVPNDVPFDSIRDPVKYTRELMSAADCARVGRGKFARTNPAEVYGEGSMSGMERLTVGDSSLKARYDEFISRHKTDNDNELSRLPGFSKRQRKISDEDEDLGLEAKRELEIEDEMQGKMEDPNKEQREILARAIKEEQLRDLKYKAEKKAEEMGILWYDDYSGCEDYAARNKRNIDVERSNANYEGNLPERRERRPSSSDDDDDIPTGEEAPKHPWDFNIDTSKSRQMAEQNAAAEKDDNPVFNLLDEKERKRLLEKKLEKQMKKIQKQMEKEKQRIEKRKEEKAEKRKQKKEGVLGLEIGNNNPATKPETVILGEVKVKDEVKKEIKEEADSDDDVDGVPMEDDKVAEVAKIKHHVIPGGLLEPEQRDTVKLALKMQPRKMVQRSNVKKNFIIKAKKR